MFEVSQGKQTPSPDLGTAATPFRGGSYCKPAFSETIGRLVAMSHKEERRIDVGV